MKYLIPTANLTFKKVFGEHPNLMMSLLNVMLPLPEGEEIAETNEPQFMSVIIKM